MENENNENVGEDVVSYGFGGDIDINLPDIPMPVAQEKKEIKER